MSGQNLGDSVVVEFEDIPNLPSRPFYYDVTERMDISEALTERQMISEPLSEVISEPLSEVISEPLSEVISEPLLEVIQNPSAAFIHATV